MFKLKAETTHLSWINFPQIMIQKGVTMDHTDLYMLHQKPSQTIPYTKPSNLKRILDHL
jgi:hypothetical protein